MVIRPKHYALIFVLFGFVGYLFYVNVMWGNSFPRSFLLSVYSFFMIFMMFAFYWELRDFWQYRWPKNNLNGLKVDYFSIRVTEGDLSAELLHPLDGSYLPLLIFLPGFSDHRLKIRHFTVPLAIAGYDVFSYDYRGSGQSKFGHKNQLPAIIADLKEVILWLQKDSRFNNRPLYLVGMSLGAIAALIQGIWCDSVKKIIAISGMADYRSNMPNSPVPFKGKWWIWLRYKLFGVFFNPPDEINHQISPLSHLQAKRKEYLSSDKWQQYTSAHLFFIHDAKDRIVPISNFIQNIEFCALPPQNWVITHHGGHMFMKYEPILLSAIYQFIKRK